MIEHNKILAKITVPRRYIKFLDTEITFGKVLKLRLHDFQREILETKKILNFIHVPVGAGKTFIFSFLPLATSPSVENSEGRAVFILPTNALIEDVRHQIIELRLYNPNSIKTLTATTLNRVQKEEKMSRFKAIERILEESDIVLTNPDIISYLIHGSYYETLKTMRDWIYLFVANNFRFFIIDEYHLMDEEESAIVNSFIYITYQLSRESPEKPKFFLLSGTPNREIISVFRKSIGHKNLRIIEIYLTRIKNKRKYSPLITLHGEGGGN